MSYYDDEMTDRAVAAYFRACARAGYIMDQPNVCLTGRTGNTIEIANIRGTLARYRVYRKNGREHVRAL